MKARTVKGEDVKTKKTSTKVEMPDDPMGALFGEEEKVMGQVYARVELKVLERFKEICKEKDTTIFKGTEIAFQLFIKEYDERKKKS